MWKPDRTAGKPLYRQIYEYLEQGIAYGEWPPGSLLPSERKLAERLGVNRSTVVQAYEELRASGWVESSVGSGTRVARSGWDAAPNWRKYTEGGTILPNLPLMRRIREVARNGDNVIDMANGELSADLFPNEAVADLLQGQRFSEHLGYDDPQGFGPLRKTLVATLLRRLGISATESSVLITSGSQQSLFLITRCLLSPGDAVAVEDPSYCRSLPMFRSAGLRVLPLPVYPDGIEPEDIERLYREHQIRMIFVNPNYQNPTGSVMSAEKRERLLRTAARLRIPIVEDDPFSLTSFGGEPPLPLKASDREGIVLYIGSLSKIAASGLRIGWMIAPRTVIGRLTDARQQMDFGLSVVSQWLAERLLQSEEFGDHLRRLQHSLREKQQKMADALHRHLGRRVSFHLPEGGLNLWCKIDREPDGGKLVEEGIKRGILFLPGSVFGSEPGFVRLSYAKPGLHQIGPGIEAFAHALETL
ncbi:PLP-dependent aminotransferase family protein [Cohnella candidum]|uniref:PLP-dependent aminotransferase family protein n=1 Tax=Cohnella candidum TaxID=2674991 RepID=A0A3G3K092_9BACL|nr:PLP-dependent aminotransferase family protein [Cohnella candidum]AYQ73935.1 PLP-dependent aminotransferase family protein [Cohnella candidum]